MAENTGAMVMDEQERLQVQNTDAFKNILNLPVTQFVEDTYTGKGGYRDGSYLIPHPREVFYNTRRQNCYYKNFFRSIIRAMVDPVFCCDVWRDVDDEMYGAFIDNADNAGTPLSTIVKNALKYARIHGVSFIVMDNLPEAEQPATAGEAIEQRKMPYIYMRKSGDVHEKKANSFGVLTEITFYDGEVTEGTTKYQQYRQWTATEWIIYRRQQGFGNEGKMVEVNRGTHGLGVVPVIPVLDFADTHSLEQLPDPPLYELARLNFALFNLESEIRMMEQTQSFSVFYCAGMDANSITLGIHNALLLPKDVTMPPGYASPDAQHLVNLVSNAGKLKDDIYLIAQRNGVVGVQSAASGVAKEWDFRAEEGVLKATAQAARNLERNIADMFSRYTMTAIEYDPKYPEQFNPTYENDRMQIILQTADRMPPSEVIDELWKEFAQLYWKSSPETRDRVVQSLELRRDDRDYSRVNDGAGDAGTAADGNAGAAQAA